MTTTSSSRNPFRDPTPSPASLDSGLDEELPPAYTPSPDLQQGESTVQVGPRRPFQPAPAPPPRPVPVPTPVPQVQQRPPQIRVQSPSGSSGGGSLLRQLAETITTQITDRIEARTGGSNSNSDSWSSFPGARAQASSAARSNSSSGYGSGSLRAPALPPRPASTTNVSPPGHTRTTSDFALDFYAAGTGSDEGHQRSASTSYAPPSGPPPSSHSAPTSPSSPSTPAAPTTSPTPGRPLLRDGKLLVYPKGVICPKCNNIGYKHADPSHPCKKCWSRYARPFSGPLAYSYSSSEPNSPQSPDRSQTTFQRPLPAFKAPRGRESRLRHSSPPPPRAPPQPQPQPQSFYQQYPQQQPYAPYQPAPQVRTLDPYSSHQPPPGSLVYAPGDPRLGGRLCGVCEGRGSMNLFLIEVGCVACGGVGRVW